MTSLSVVSISMTSQEILCESPLNKIAVISTGNYFETVYVIFVSNNFHIYRISNYPMKTVNVRIQNDIRMGNLSVMRNALACSYILTLLNH